MKGIEILAPAGSFEAMKAAFSAGGDAVYIGGTKFGARAYAENPDTEELLRAIDYAHIRGKRLYLTVNTLLKQAELEEELYAYLLPYYEAGLDAVIVQDVGAMRFIAENFPALPIHASTQMTLTQALGTELFAGLNVTRLVPAREISLAELSRLKAETGLEIEAFVHGALCFCYSGQCLMSSLIGGRSGNRGRCAQPCRLEYAGPDGNKAFLLSTKDLCALDFIPELAKAGVCSFKIEGRMKRPEYAAGVTAVYRYFTDLYEELGAERYAVWLKTHKEDVRRAKLALLDMYNRGGFTDGYFCRHNGREMLSAERPNHAGVFVGTVSRADGGGVQYRLNEDVNAQDVLEIRAADGTAYEFTRKDAAAAGALAEVRVNGGVKARKGDKVFRVKNARLLEELNKRYVLQEKKTPATGAFFARAGEVCTLTVAAEAKKPLLPLPFSGEGTEPVSVRTDGFFTEAAEKQPATAEAVKRPLEKTNDTPFVFTELSVQLDGGVFLPNGQLNALRRTALTALEETIAARYRRRAPAERKHAGQETAVADKPSVSGESGALLFVQIEEEEQLEAALLVPEAAAVYVNRQDEGAAGLCRLAERIHAAGKAAYLVLPHIFRKAAQARYEREEALFSCYDGFLVRNYEEVGFLRRREYDAGKTLILNYNLYVMNKEAKRFYEERGITELTAPVELNAGEWKKLGIQDMTTVVYGRLPLMVSAQCFYKNGAECRNGKEKGRKEPLFLTDRLGKRYAVRQSCVPCYNTIYNPECLSLLSEADGLRQLGAKKFRLDFTFETKEETKRVLAEAVRVLCRRERTEPADGYTKGHYKRGVR